MNTQPTLKTLTLLGILITIPLAAIAFLAPKFIYGTDLLERPIIPFIALLMVSALIYLIAVSHTRALFPSRNFFITTITLGLIMRATLFLSNPILEDDYYRYLWDGGVTASGHNPYAHIPENVRTGRDTQALGQLARESVEVAARVNHPELGTVYPPVAQAAFAIAHVIKPWSIYPWKAILLFADIATLCLLIAILRKTGLPETRILIYWWNPLLIKEIYNAAHMDLLVVMFLALAIYFAVHQKTLRTFLALTAAIATKLWPVILIPLLLRHSSALKPERKQVLLLSGALLLILLIPTLWAIPLGQKSGLLAYGQHWEMNDLLYMLIHQGIQTLTDTLGLNPSPATGASGILSGLRSAVTPHLLARITVATLLLLWILFLAKKRTPQTPDTLNRLTLATAALFMLSPTQFPWYYLWILPLLTLSPRPSLLLLTLTLPLYYLKFHYDAHNTIDTFHTTIPYIEFTPTLLLLTYEAITTRLDLKSIAPTPQH